MAGKKTGVTTLRGSKRARQIAVAVLEALSGAVGTTEAAEKLGVSLSRYYQLEARALRGMLEAVEPRSRGPRKTPEGELKVLRTEKKQLERELRRHQSLLRAAHRSVGLPGRGPKRASSKGRVRAKRGSRGTTVLQTLRRGTDGPEGGADGTAKRHGSAGGRDPGQQGGA
jgi:hypothetical protein